MSQPVRRRTSARELCLQYLYMYEFQPDNAPNELDAFIEHHTKGNRDRDGRAGEHLDGPPDLADQPAARAQAAGQ